MRKNGRNEPCWCGSGIKYKRCHLGREKDEPVSVWDIRKLYNLRYSEKFCVHPLSGNNNCSGEIVRAHSIQRKGGLDTIASKDGFVYSFIPDGVDLAKHLQKKRDNKNASKDEDFVLVSPKRIGTRQASTFTGFCGKHDKSTFRPLEDFPYNNSPEQVFLLAYRAICRSYFMKSGNVKFFPQTEDLDRGHKPIQQLVMQTRKKILEKHINDAYLRIGNIKKEYDDVYVAQDFPVVHYYTIGINKMPEIMCNGAATIFYDFQGKSLQETEELLSEHQHITLSIITTPTGGAVVFAWIGEYKSIIQLIRSLNALPQEDICNAVIRFAFEYFENIFTKPQWWDTLEKEQQEKILRRSTRVRYTPEGLKDDGVRVVDWVITSINTNISLS